jgi:hypothetical protein
MSKETPKEEPRVQIVSVTTTVKTVTTTDANGKVTTETTTTVTGDPASLSRAVEMLEIVQRLSNLGRKPFER